MPDPFAPPGHPPPAYPPPAYQPPAHLHPGHPQQLVAPAPPAPRRTWLVVLVTALVAGLVGLLLGVTGTLAVQSLAGTADAVPAADDAADDAAGRSASAVVPERLPELVAWIEDTTGETFTATPQVVVLDEDAFERAVLAPSSSTGGEPASLPTDDWTSTVTALGLVTDPDAFDDYNETGFADGVVGFYDPADQVVRLRDTTWGPSMEVTLVHELVHALQDQVVDLDAVTARTSYHDETYAALTAVIEGQATLVEQHWLDEQGEDYSEEYWDDVPDGGDDAYEPFGAAMGYLPYDVGGYAMLVLEDSEGPQAVFDALATPPTSLEQLWDVEGWRAGDASEADPVDLPDPAPADGAEVLDRGSLGVHVLSLLTIPDPDAYLDLPGEDELPLSGWAGDEYVTWADGDQVCTQVVVATDTAADAAAWVQDLRVWQGDGGTVTTDGSDVLLRRCA